MEDSADYYDPSLGVRLIGEDFSTRTAGSNPLDSSNQWWSNGFKWASDNAAAISLSAVEDAENKYLKITTKGISSWSNLVLEGTSRSTAALYTLKARFNTEDSRLSGIYPKLVGLGDFKAVKTFVADGSWHDAEYSYTTTDGQNWGRLQFVFYTSESTATPTVYMDDMELYCKPTASDTYDVSVDFPTVTVTAQNGFDANAVKAITAEPAKYLSDSAASVAFTETTMTITLKSADEFTIPSIVNNAGTATYPATKVAVPDYNTLLYGLKNYYWSASSKSVEGTNVTDKTNISSYEFKHDENMGDYLETKYTSQGIALPTVKRDTSIPYDLDYTYTYIMGFKIHSSEGSYYIKLRRFDATAEDVYNRSIKCNEWVNHAVDYKLQNDYEVSAAKNNSAFPDAYIWSDESDNTVDISYIGLYYKPVKSATASLKTTGKNTAAVTYPEGIDKAQAAALETYFKKYFGGDVTALTVSGNDVAVTLADGVESVTMPALINENGTATYEEVVVTTPVNPISDESLTTIRGRYPAGLRFQSHFAVGYMADANLTEFGYVVARKDVLGDTVLTAENDSFDKKIVSPSYKSDGSVKKFDYGAENVTFAAVLVNIPKDNYKDEFAVRPYVVYGGQYFYGDTMTKSIYAVAESLKDGATADVAKVIDKILNGEELDKYTAQ